MAGLSTSIMGFGLGLVMSTTEPAPKTPATVEAPPPSADPNGNGDSPPPSSPAPELDPTEADPPPAAIRAQQYFQAQEWDLAIEALMEAYAADPNPAYLYARAQAERMRGNCRVAIALYERFLESGTTEQQREDTQRHVRLCEEKLFNEEAHTPLEPGPPAPEPGPEDRPPWTDDEPEPEPRPWFRDPAGLTLLATGTAAVAVGGIMWGLGARELDRAPEANIEEAYERQVTQGRRDIAIGATVVGIGAAVMLSGTIRLAVRARRSRVTASGWLGPRSAGLGVRTRF